MKPFAAARSLVVSFELLSGYLVAQPVLRSPRPSAPPVSSPPFRRDRMRVQRYPRGFDTARARLKAIEQMERAMGEQQAAGISPQPWTDIGPRPTVNGSWRWGAWTDSIAVDPTDSQTVYIGNPGSGVWKTADGGTTWNPKMDNAPAMGIGAIAVAPSNSSIVYAGTGNWDYGVGILKSIDKGNTWTLLPGPFQGPFGPNQYFDGGFIIVALAVHPQNPNIVLAGAFEGQQSRRGIYRSTDGGSNWTQVFSGGRGTSFAWNPQNPNIVYAAIGDFYSPAQNGIYKSADGGFTWILSQNGVAPTLVAGAIEIFLSICASAPNVLYASLFASGGGTLAVIKTVNSGTTWTTLPIPTSPRGFQVTVHPQDPNIVFVGDVKLYRSQDGGQTWQNVTSGISFTDFRSFVFSSDGGVFYVGSDGGMWKTSDPALSTINWTPLNDTLETTLFYPGSPISIHPTDPKIGFGGAQDLGILKYSGTKAWQQVQGCDGGTTLIDPTNPQNVYATCQGISIYKSTSGGAVGTWTSTIAGIVTTDRARFVPTIELDLQNPQRLLYGTYRLYQSLNGAQTWAPISQDLSNGCSAGIASISISPINGNAVYVGGQCNGTVYVSTNAMVASPTWTDRSAGLPNNRDVTRVVAGLTDPMIAYVTMSGFTWPTSTQGHVFRTQNAGVTWTDISSNLPNIPVNDLSIDPDIPGTLYVATDIGVFSTSNGGASWAPLSTGLPRAYVQNIRVHQPSRILRAATLGRGMWDLDIRLTTPTVAPAGGIGSAQAFTFTYTDLAGYQNVSGSQIIINSTTSPAGACYILFGRGNNAVTLVNDAGTPGPLTTLGAPTVLQNSQCSVLASISSQSGAGSAVTLTLYVVFKPAFAGPKNVYSAFSTNGGLSSGLKQVGTFTATINTTPISAVSVTPTSGTGQAQAFTFNYFDPNGYPNISGSQVLFSASTSAVGQCYILFARGTNQIALLDGTGNNPTLAPLGGQTVLQNSQCSVLAANSYQSGSGTNLFLTLFVAFKPAFAGAKNIYSGSTDNGGNRSAFAQLGTWTVPATAPPLAVNSVTPAAATGPSNPLTFVFSDPNGFADISGGQVIVNPTLTGAGSCYVQFTRAGLIALAGDDGASTTTANVGQATFLQNSQCMVNAAASSITGNGNYLSLTLFVTMKTPGVKNVYTSVSLNGGATSGYLQVGTWNVTSPASLTPVSVSPGTGAGPAGTPQYFTFTYSDPNGASDISGSQIIINPALQGASACYVLYGRGTNLLAMANDNASSFTQGTLGTGGTLQNSQCSIDLPKSFQVQTGNTVNLTLAVTFNPNYKGLMYAFSNVVNNAGNASNFPALGPYLVQ